MQGNMRYYLSFLLVYLVHLVSCTNEERTNPVDNPYEAVKWETSQHLHGGSHLHSRSPAQWEQIYDMGIRHLTLSNYYPSQPYWPLPEEFLADRPDLVTAPNAEQHGSTDHDLHFTVPGSFYTTGYGRGFSSGFNVDWSRSPFRYTFTDLNRFNPESESPGEGVYRLDLRRDAIYPGQAEDIVIEVTLAGARICDHSTFETIGNGLFKGERMTAEGPDSVYFCVMEDEVTLEVNFDPQTTRIDRMRVMQGTNRPWRVAFREALNGDRRDKAGRPLEGLQYADGGGIIINHPRHPVEESIEMLTFDERVLGVEVWNHRRWFGLEENPPHLAYYEHWNELLRRGHRAFGFFVKDHRLTGRGRNILLVPDLAGRSTEQRQRDALRSYRKGQFYGLLGAWDQVDEEGRVEQPYDYSEFSFRRIELHRDERGIPEFVRVEVGGHDLSRRPRVQIRFISERGVERIVDGRSLAQFDLPMSDAGFPDLRFIRVEAFAYPETHRNGEPLTADRFSELNVYEIARIHDQLGYTGNNDVDVPGMEPVGIVDMLFSQPIRFLYHDER